MKGRDFLIRLRGFPEELKGRMKVMLSAISEEMVAYAKANHPYYDRSSELTRSIYARVKVDGGRFSLILGASAPYASFLEFGTAPHFVGSAVFLKGIGFRYIGLHPGTPPSPFLRPTVEAFRGRVREETRKVLIRIMEGIK